MVIREAVDGGLPRYKGRCVKANSESEESLWYNTIKNCVL
jgi:hypothetical protein